MLLIKPEISKKMLSFNHNIGHEVTFQLVNLCKDVTFQNHFREIYDLILKWALLRIWGGRPS
jgi:hypothetical protein